MALPPLPRGGIGGESDRKAYLVKVRSSQPLSQSVSQSASRFSQPVGRSVSIYLI